MFSNHWPDDYLLLISSKENCFNLMLIYATRGLMLCHGLPLGCFNDKSAKVQCITNDTMPVVTVKFWIVTKPITRVSCKPKRIRIFARIINCTIIMKTKSRFSRNVYAISDRIWCNKHLRHITTENVIMGKADSSDLMMIIKSAMDISSQSPILKWASWTHTTPYILMKMKDNRED